MSFPSESPTMEFKLNTMGTYESTLAEFSPFPSYDGRAPADVTRKRRREDEYFKSLPPGYRFCPYDDELIRDYLKPKVFEEPVPLNQINDVNIYRYNPESLAEIYKEYGEKELYFFTPRERKYRNGSRPNRAAADGYWKATGADRPVLDKMDNNHIGFKKSLVFYKGKPPNGDKSNWIMHEYRVINPPVQIKTSENDMRLDNWVLCRMHKKTDKPKAGTQDEGLNLIRSSTESTSLLDDHEPIEMPSMEVIIDPADEMSNEIIYPAEYDKILHDQSQIEPLVTCDPSGSIDAADLMFLQHFNLIDMPNAFG